jgi:hypothetical protein
MDIARLIREELTNLFEGKAEDIRLKYYSGVPEDVFYKIISADPTTPVKMGRPDKLGRYCQWILRLYANKSLKLEDLYKVTDYLKVFDRYKSNDKIKVKDINHIKTLPDLYKVIHPVVDLLRRDQPITVGQQKQAIKQNEAEKVFEDETWLVVVPKTMKAACYYGANTQWCTASRDIDDNRFEAYNKDGHLYINIHKPSKKKFQFHFESGQFMDEQDEPINLLELLRKKENLGLRQFYIEIAVKKNPKGAELAEDIQLVTDGTNYYVTAKDWASFAPLFQSSRNQREEFFADVLGGDAHQYFEDWGEGINAGDWFASIDSSNMETIRTMLKKGDDEEITREDVEDDEEISSAIRNAVSNCQENANESEAFNHLISDITSHFGVIRSDWGKSKNRGEFLKLQIQKNMWEEFMVFAMVKEEDFNDYQDESPLKIEHESPYYGYQGDVEDDHFNEELANQLSQI